MKCIKILANQFGTVSAQHANQMVVRRVTDAEAFDLVIRQGRWQYTDRGEWKTAGRKWGLGLAGG